MKLERAIDGNWGEVLEAVVYKTSKYLAQYGSLRRRRVRHTPLIDEMPAALSRIFALPAFIQGVIAIVEIDVAAFCACCGAEITLKAEPCPVCGTPQHGMSEPDLLLTLDVDTDPYQEDVGSDRKLRKPAIP